MRTSCTSCTSTPAASESFCTDCTLACGVLGHSICVAEIHLAAETAAPPKRHEYSAWRSRKLAPVTVTAVAPVLGPMNGDAESAVRRGVKKKPTRVSEKSMPLFEMRTVAWPVA